MVFMTPETRARIFAGESGGDYDALYGFTNRKGPFAGTRVSEMTLGELDAFDENTYGPWSEGQLGYRATPTGAYQIVGDTRRAAADALGLGPDTVYDKTTQDRMGEWILQNQGTGAWEGYDKGGNAVVSSRNIGGAPGGFTGLGMGGALPSADILKLLMGGEGDFDIAQLAAMMGVEPEPMTRKDKILGMMTGVQDVLRAGGQGHASDFAMTNAFLKSEENRRAMRGIVAAGGLGGAGGPAAAAAQQLTSMGRDDLAQAVASGAMEPQKGLELAVANRPLPGQSLSHEQESLATSQQAAYLPIARQAQTVAQTTSEIDYLLSGKSRFGDKLALQRVAKALDPISVTKEGEVAFIASAAGGLRATVNEFLSMIDQQNGIMTPPQRAEITALAAELKKNMLAAAGQERQQRAAQLRAQGIDPDVWLIDPSEYSFTPGEPPKAADWKGAEGPAPTINTTPQSAGTTTSRPLPDILK